MAAWFDDDYEFGVAAYQLMSDKYRVFIHEEAEKNTTWRFGAPPNYDVVNKLFDEGKTQEWPKGSLEAKVQRMVKTWEMEIFHKVNTEDFKTMDPEKYSFSLNGRPESRFSDEEKIGGYNIFLQTSLPEKFRAYNASVETSESSHRIFVNTFPRGFALEIFQVYSGPPVIVYKFRHWAFMEGPFMGNPPTGDMVQFYGIGIVKLDDANKIVKVELFFDPNELLGQLLKGASIEGSEASPILSSACPFLQK